MTAAAEELRELRQRVGSELTSVGSGPQVKAGVRSMARLPLPLTAKYRSIDAEALVRCNTTGDSRAQVMERMGRLAKALNILEKYGCNLTNPSKPRYWRSVKHNNPVFQSTVDGMQGGRGILNLYGYTTQNIDGLSFPDDVAQPDINNVAAVTVEIMCLCLEVNMLIKGTHPHPEIFKDVVPLVVPQVQPEKKGEVVVSPGEVTVARGTSSKTPPPIPTKILYPTPTKTPPPTPTKTPPPTPTKTPHPTPTKTPHPTPTKTPPPIPTKTPPPTPTKTPIFSPNTSITTATSNPPTPMSTPTMTSLVSPTSPTSTTAVLPPTPAPRHHFMPPPGQEAKATTLSPPSNGCNLCGAVSTVICPSCSPMLFCEPCDGLYHRNPTRASHKRETIQTANKELCTICGSSSVDVDCTICVKKLCRTCDNVYHRHPDRTVHKRTDITPDKAKSSLPSPWTCSHCSMENLMRAVLCVRCERPRLATPCPSPQDDPLKLLMSPTTEWECKSCTMINQGSSVLCGACERPRLAIRPSFSTPTFSSPTSLGTTPTKWTCQYCTYLNPAVSSMCEMCTSPSRGEGGVTTGLPLIPPQALFPDQSPAKPPPQSLHVLLDQKKRADREDGMGLMKHFKEAEKKGVSPEEVCAALVSCGGSNPCDWLISELPHLLDQICAMATSSVKLNNDAGDSETAGAIKANGDTEGQRGPNAVVGGAEIRLSRAEAKQAWLAAGGDVQQAAKRLLRDRKAKMRELHSLGFQDEGQCHEALWQSGGEIRVALSLLQRPLLEPFHQRINANQSEAPIDANNPDKQRTCRRLLALYGVPSWGRCELALSLLQEVDVQYTLEDVVQAVKESHDREFIRRILATQCQACLEMFPRNKLQSLTSCQCAMCHECFQQFFNIRVKEGHIVDMVCPYCNSLDINDPEQMQSYFSTLDIQLRDCLEHDVFEIYKNKLMEHTVMKDPKFLWCCHCTFGFIYEGNQLKVTCLDCRECFCAKCKKPWEPQHQDISCEKFLQWKRENDPDSQKQGLAGFLLQNGITCPSCGFKYDLAKGGCMHFTCTRCKHQFCNGCNSPFHKAACKNIPCMMNCLHAHHPRDCLFYLRDWEPPRLQDLLQKHDVAFNTDPPNDAENDACTVMQQKEEKGLLVDMACGDKTGPGQAGLCEKHYREYLVSLINDSSLDPALLYNADELLVACRRYQVVVQREESEEEAAYNSRLLEKLKEVPLGDKVPRRK